jgi:hypothetical protein
MYIFFRKKGIHRSCQQKDLRPCLGQIISASLKIIERWQPNEPIPDALRTESIFLTPCFAYGVESAFSSLPRNVHPIPVAASLPSASLCTPSERLPPERRLPLMPSDSPIARIAREEAEGLELDGHGEEAREPIHRDTRVERLDGGATGLDGGSGASVERKRRARRRELRGSTAGAKLQW